MEQAGKDLCPSDRTNNKDKIQRLFSINEELPNPLVLVSQKIRGPLRWGCKVKNTSPMLSKCGKPNVKAVPTVGNPVGLAFGTLNITDFLKKERPNCSLLQGYATCLMAFGEIYLTPEPEWNHHVLNGILQEGANHIANCLKKLSDEEFAEVDVVSKCFTLRRNAMEVWMSEPIVVGMMECTTSRVYSFEVGIAMFMRKYQYCLLRVENRFYLIWKKGRAYFLFDCYGRMVTCKSDFERGDVALICVGTLKKIDILMTYLGQVSPNSIYSLYELKMIRLMECCDQPFVCSGLGRQFNYELISNDHARLLSSFHIATNCFRENRYKQAIAMGLIAIIYSKIDVPCTWDTSIVDKILIMGNRYYGMWTGFNPENCLTIHEIPRKVLVGQFKADIVIFPAAACGNWVNLPDYQACEITRAIRNLFKELKCSNILVQVDRKTYAIWRRNQFYYLFDPYPQELIHSTKNDGRKRATVHLFNSLKLLCCVLTQDIIGISLPCKFSVHVVKILSLCKVNVQNLPEEPPWSCVDPRIKIDVEEALSLNESVYDILCEETLACATDQYDIGYCNLDIPPLSETHNLPESEKAEAEEHPSSEEEGLIEEEKAAEEEDEQQEEEQSEDSEAGKKKSQKKPGKSKPSKKPKPPKPLKPSKKDKGKGDETDESTSEEETDKKGKGKGKEKGKGNKEKSKDRKRGGKDTDKKGKDTDKKGKDTKKKGKDTDKKDKGKDIGKESDKKARGDEASSEESVTSLIMSEKSISDKPSESSVSSEEMTMTGDQKTVSIEEFGKYGMCPPAKEPKGGWPKGSGCLPNSYPGYSYIPRNLAVVGTETGTYQSLCELVRSGLQVADRILTMTAWGNYVVFKNMASFLLYDGCTCNPCRFRNIDLSIGTAGLLCFDNMHDVIIEILKGKNRPAIEQTRLLTAEEICNEFC